MPPAVQGVSGATKIGIPRAMRASPGGDCAPWSWVHTGSEFVLWAEGGHSPGGGTLVAAAPVLQQHSSPRVGKRQSIASTHPHPVGGLGYLLRLARRSRRVTDNRGPQRVEQSKGLRAALAWRTLDGAARPSEPCPVSALTFLLGSIRVVSSSTISATPPGFAGVVPGLKAGSASRLRFTSCMVLSCRP